MDPSEVTEIRDIVIESARHVLPMCGIAADHQSDGANLQNSSDQLVAFMGFSGEMLRGTLTLVAPIALMRETYPLPLTDGPRSELDVFDWSAEIANRLLGRIKNGLASRGLEVEPSTPRVMIADQIQILRSLRGSVCSVFFSAGPWPFGLWFDAIAPEGVALFSAERVPDETPPEGDVLLF